MQLIPQDERKQRLIYKVCLFILPLFCCGVFVFPFVLNNYANNRHLQNIAGLTFVGSFIPVSITIYVLYHLKITSHYEAGNYSLPYKVRKRTIFQYIFIGFCIYIYPQLLYPYEMAADIMIGLFLISGLLGILYMFVTWHGVILYEDHLCHYIRWVKHNLAYQDVTEVKVELFSDIEHRSYYLDIYSSNKVKPAIVINLASIPKPDRIIILNAIHQHAPDTPMNELAEQMRQGDFPVI